MPSITEIDIIDCDKNVSVLKLTDGITLYRDAIPKNFTIRAIASSDTTSVTFNRDNGAFTIKESAPFDYSGKLVPIVTPGRWSEGDHNITVTPLGGTPLSINFTFKLVTPAPAPAPVPSVVAFENGTNFGGITDAQSNPSKYPIILNTMSHFGMNYSRFWTTGSLLKPFASSQWSLMSQYRATNISTVAVINFQNMGNVGDPLRGKCPTSAIWESVLNAIPEPSITGVTHFEIGNEIDYSAYYNDTIANYVNLLKIGSPILRSKGYKVVCANLLSGLSWYQGIQNLGGFQYVDFIGRHAYENSALTALSEYDQLITLAAQNNVQVMCTEVGLHCNPNDLAGWASQTELLWQGLKSRNGIFIQFPIFVMATTGGPEGLLLSNLSGPNALFYNAMDSALGTAII